jgi:hypothetical protein
LADTGDALDDFSDTVDLTGALDAAREGSGLATALAGLPAGGVFVDLVDFAEPLEPVEALGVGASFGTDFTTGFNLDLGNDLATDLGAFLATGFVLATGLDFGAGLDFDLAMTGVFLGMLRNQKIAGPRA